jgi:hypothetical protein
MINGKIRQITKDMMGRTTNYEPNYGYLVRVVKG